ncbi:DNA polymerase zeta catalytic subunit-like protein [Tanacetum coccineum]|uniref:DNA polymerase zeta catalytic subunit-like protein n=1 Tax=Tanacetum coccineum TaxID=301880 RepID=A0ABQ5DJ88_9ASTR
MTRRAKKSEYLASYSWDYDRSTGKYGRCECGNDCDGVSKCVSMTLSYLVEAGMTMTEAVMGTSATARISKGEGDSFYKGNWETPLELDDKVVTRKRQRDDNISKMRQTRIKTRVEEEVFEVNQEEAKGQETRNRQQWREAIKSEIESILQNHTWELVVLPPGCKPLGYKWIFKKKMKADGTVDKYKAKELHYDRHPAVIEGYSDSNWISDIKDSRSTSGYVFTQGGPAISGSLSS